MPETIRETQVAGSEADLLAQTVIAARTAGSVLRERFGAPDDAASGRPLGGGGA